MTLPVQPGVSTAAPARGRWRVAVSERARSQRRLAALLCAPAVLVILAVTGYPIGYALYLSLERFDLRFPEQRGFVGLANYGAVLSSGYWWQAFTVTLIITVVSVVIEFVIGLALALAMYRTSVGRGLVRTVVLIPYGIVTVVASYGWQFAWTPGKGYLAALLPEGVAPLTDQVAAIAVIILAEVWKTTPFMALLLLAGLALVPEDLLKAAAMDGAGPWQRLTKVILPIMKPAILAALLFRTLDAFRVFDSIYILTQGSNGRGSVSMLTEDEPAASATGGRHAAADTADVLGAAQLVTRLSVASTAAKGHSVQVWFDHDQVQVFDPSDGRTLALGPGVSQGAQVNV